MLIVKYTTDWVKDFASLKLLLDTGLEGLQYHIEHVGSTAVPNLDAKPIIDIDIIYSKQTDFDKIKFQLEKMGYYHNGNQGIKDRDVFKRTQRSTNELLDTIKHHLYVCPVNSQALERHILSRDFLRKNDRARLEYQQIKYKLAEKAEQDRKKYADLKELNANNFIDAIIKTEKNEYTTKSFAQTWRDKLNFS